MSGVDGTQDLSRREILRRGAALGAAVAVATPVVQGLGRISAFAQVTPPPEEENGEPVSFPSHFQLIFTVGATGPFYGIKWDNGWGKIGGPPHGEGSRCWDPDNYRGEGYSDATSDQFGIFADYAVVTEEVDDEGEKGAYVLDPTGLIDLDIAIIDAATFDGSATGGFSGKCDLPIQPDPDGRYRFWKP